MLLNGSIMTSLRSSKVTPPSTTDYGEVIKDYLFSDRNDRIDILQSTPNLDGFVYYADSVVTTMSLTEIQRSGPRTAPNKTLYGASGTSSSYYVFSSDMDTVISNFITYDYSINGKTTCPTMLPIGPKIKETIGTTSDSRYVKKFMDKVVIPTDKHDWIGTPTSDATILYMPTVIPLFLG